MAMNSNLHCITSKDFRTAADQAYIEYLSIGESLAEAQREHCMESWPTITQAIEHLARPRDEDTDVDVAIMDALIEGIAGGFEQAIRMHLAFHHFLYADDLRYAEKIDFDCFQKEPYGPLHSITGALGLVYHENPENPKEVRHFSFPVEMDFDQYHDDRYIAKLIYEAAVRVHYQRTAEFTAEYLVLAMRDELNAEYANGVEHATEFDLLSAFAVLKEDELIPEAFEMYLGINHDAWSYQMQNSPWILLYNRQPAFTMNYRNLMNDNGSEYSGMNEKGFQALFDFILKYKKPQEEMGLIKAEAQAEPDIPSLKEMPQQVQEDFLLICGVEASYSPRRHEAHVRYPDGSGMFSIQNNEADAIPDEARGDDVELLKWVIQHYRTEMTDLMETWIANQSEEAVDEDSD